MASIRQCANMKGALLKYNNMIVHSKIKDAVSVQGYDKASNKPKTKCRQVYPVDCITEKITSRRKYTIKKFQMLYQKRQKLPLGTQ